MRASIQAVSRPSFAGYWTPQRFWASETSTEVEIVDGEEDPKLEDGSIDRSKIGQATWRQVQAEGFLSVKVLADAPNRAMDAPVIDAPAPAPARGRPRAVPASE
jgi:hypothetical protein